MDNIDVDTIWKKLGPLKRYSALQLFYLFFVCFQLTGYSLIEYVFVGYGPPYKCAPLTNQTDLYKYGILNNISSSRITYDKCNIEIQSNTSNITSGTYKLTCLEGYQYDSKQETIVTEWDLVCSRAGLGPMTQMFVTIGQGVGALLFPSISDRYGRKPVLTFSLVICTLTSVAAGFVPGYIIYSILRFAFGAVQQGFILTAQVYITELFPKEQRGTVSGFGGLGWSITMVLLSLWGYLMRNTSWRYIHLFLGLFGVPCLFTYWIVDESLRWLIANKRADEAKTLVRKIAKFNKVDFNDILPLIQHNDDIDPRFIHQNPKEEKRENILTIARHKILLKTAFIMAFTWMTNAMTYFGLTLNSAKLAGNRFLNLFLYQVVEIFAMLMFLFIINRIKRRHVSMLFHGIAGVSLVLSALLGSFKDYSDHFVTVSVALSFVGKFGISASFSTIFLYTPELFPTNLRNIGIGIASSAGRIGGLLAPFSTLLTEYIEWGPGVVFGVCCISVTVLQHFLPESSGREMPQTVQELKAWKSDKTSTIVR